MNNNYIGVDLDLFRQPKIQRLELQHGKGGVAIYLQLYLKLAENNNTLLESDLPLLEREFFVKMEQIKSVIFDFDLFVVENGTIYSRIIADKLSAIRKLQKDKSRAGKLGAEKRWSNREKHSSAISSANGSAITDPLAENSNKIKGKEIKEKVKENKIESFFANPLFELQKNKNFSLLTNEEIALSLETFYQSYPKASDLTTFNFLRDENNKKLKNNPTQKTNTNSKMEIEVEEQDLEMMRELYPTAILSIKK